MTHAIVLYSGGLDSLLAARVLMAQGIRVTGFHCVLPFAAPDLDLHGLKAARLAKECGIPLEFFRCGDEYVELVKNPPHGYGSNMNPCVDCKIYFIGKAAQYMREAGADFVATGEVVGQRPMSQLKHTMNHIRNVTGLEGRLLRPLSAKLLKPTVMEETGLVDRERLYGLSGRSRKPQMSLARELGIAQYASPAGGCLFTDPNIARRVKDLVTHHPHCNAVDFYLLTVGRQYRLHDDAKIIVAKNAFQNNELIKHARRFHSIFIPDFRGPAVGLYGVPREGDRELAGAVIAHHGKPGVGGEKITVMSQGAVVDSFIPGEPAGEAFLESMRV